MTGALLVCGTASDAGKSVVTAGICRSLARRGVRVAPFKAQNMSNNSAVTASGAEIGRAQAMQAAACGIEPEAAMNPVLIKPAGETSSQVLLMGKPYAEATARSYQGSAGSLRQPVLDALDSLRARFDAVICEGAGSPAEINLRERDLANMGLARAAGLPVLLVGDIDRGGVFASLIGTLAVLDAEDQRHVAAFLINKFRGDATLLAPGLEMAYALTGRRTIGVLPWCEGLWLDAEDSLALQAPALAPAPAVGRDTLDVAVVRLRWISNFTDLDALAAEPGVAVRYTRSPADIERADLVVIPGTKATVADLGRCARTGSTWRWPVVPRPAVRSSESAAATSCWASGSRTRSRAAPALLMALDCCRSRPCSPPTSCCAGRAGQQHRGLAAPPRPATRSATATRARAAAASRS